MFVLVRTNTGVPVLGGGKGGGGELNVMGGGDVMLEIVTGGELIVRGGGELMFDACTETGAEDSKSPKSSKDTLD